MFMLLSKIIKISLIFLSFHFLFCLWFINHYNDYMRIIKARLLECRQTFLARTHTRIYICALWHMNLYWVAPNQGKTFILFVLPYIKLCKVIKESAIKFMITWFSLLPLLFHAYSPYKVLSTHSLIIQHNNNNKKQRKKREKYLFASCNFLTKE